MNFSSVLFFLVMIFWAAHAHGPLYKFFQNLVDMYNKRRLEVTTELPETTPRPKVPTNGSIYQLIVDNEPIKLSQTGNYSASTFLNYPNYSIIAFVYNYGEEAKDEKVVGINSQVQRFPPFLEYFLQRIQSYFSIYKYEDQSRPVRPIRVPIVVNDNGTIVIGDPVEIEETTTELPNETIDTTNTEEETTDLSTNSDN